MLPNILTIYTTGDALFLQNVMNAIAMVTGTGSFVTASALGLLFGIILMAFKSLQTGKGFDLASIVICWIAWNFFFGATATVNIHDVITEEDRPVDNVPAGVAIAGWGMSNIGYGITEIMEQAFQSPYSESTITGAMAGNGGVFNDTVRTLNTVATIGLNPQILASIDQDNGPKSNFRVSASNFIKDCTLTAFDLGYRSEQNIFNKSLKEGIDFPEANGVYFTRIIDGSGTNGSVSCDTAFDKIDNMMDKALRNSGSYTNTTLTGLLTGHEHKTENSSLMGEGMQKASDLFNSMSSMNADVQEFMKTAIMFDMFSQGELKQARDSRDFATSLMMVQARQQRNMQWSAESNMFQKTMRPIMTFMEGFTYAITPFCGFLLLLGMFGVKLSLKYFMLIAWVQSWLPCLAIANAYLNSSLQRAIWGFRGMDTTTYDPNSFMAVKVLADTTQDFLATGGMFIGAIPVVTLFIFSGSVYALNSLAGRMNGQDFINEKVASPDAISPAPLVQALSQQSTQFGVGAQNRNWESLSMQYSDKSSVTGAYNNLIARSNNLASTISDSYGNLFNHAQNIGLGTTFSKALGNVDSDTKSRIEAVGQSWINAQNQNRGTSLSGEGGVAFGIGAALLGASAKVNGGMKLSEELSKGLTDSQQKMINSALNEANSNNIQDSIQTALTEDERLANSLGISSSKQKQIANSYSKVKSATDSYQKAKNTARSSAVTWSRDIPTLARDLKQYGSADKIIKMYNEQSQDNESLRANMEAYQRRYTENVQLSGLDQKEAYAIAALRALSEVNGDQGAMNRYNIVQALDGKEMDNHKFSTTNEATSYDASEVEPSIAGIQSDVNAGQQKVKNEVHKTGADSLNKDKVVSTYSQNRGTVTGSYEEKERIAQKEDIEKRDGEVLANQDTILQNMNEVAHTKATTTALESSVVGSMKGKLNDLGMPTEKLNFGLSAIDITDDKIAETITKAAEDDLENVSSLLSANSDRHDNSDIFDKYVKVLETTKAQKFAETQLNSDDLNNVDINQGGISRQKAINKLATNASNAVNDFLEATGMSKEEYKDSGLENAANIIATNPINSSNNGSVNVVKSVRDRLDLIGAKKREDFNGAKIVDGDDGYSVANKVPSQGGGEKIANKAPQPVVQSSSQNGSAAIQTGSTTNVNSEPVNTNLSSANSDNNVPIPRTSNQNSKQAQPVVQNGSKRGDFNKPVTTLNKR